MAYLDPSTAKAVMVWPQSAKFTWEIYEDDDPNPPIRKTGFSIDVYYATVEDTNGDFVKVGNTINDEFTLELDLAKFYWIGVSIVEPGYSWNGFVNGVFSFVFIACNNLAYQVGHPV